MRARRRARWGGGLSRLRRWRSGAGVLLARLGLACSRARWASGSVCCCGRSRSQDAVVVLGAGGRRSGRRWCATMGLDVGALMLLVYVYVEVDVVNSLAA